MKNSIILSILILNFLFFTETDAQISKTDSLENLLTYHTQEDTIRATLLNDIAYELRKKEGDKAFKYAAEAGELADKIGFKKGKARSFRIIGLVYKYKPDYSKAIEYHQKSLKIYEEIGDKKGLARNYNNIGNIYRYQDVYTKALEYYQKSLEKNKEIGRNKGIASNYTNIGNIYEDKGDYPKALEYFQKALKIKKELNDSIEISYSYNTIGNLYNAQASYTNALKYQQKALKINKKIERKNGISTNYNNIGNIYRNLGNNNKALEYLKKSLEINKEIKSDYGIALNYNNIGVTLINIGEYTEAYDYFKKSLSISTRIGKKYVEAYSYTKLALLFLKQQKFKEAIKYSKKAYDIANKRDRIDLINESAGILAKSCAGLGLYKKAYHYYVVFKTTNDSIYGVENVRKLTTLEYQYQYEQEKQVAELEQQKKDAVNAEKIKHQKNIRNYFITGFAIMLLFALIIFFSFIQKRKANHLLAEQKKEIEAQAEELKTANGKLIELNQFKQAMTGMIVHDLKNPLNAIINAPQSLSFQEQNKKMKQSGKQMLNLVLNILDVYKYENAVMTVDKIEHSLFEISQNAINEVRFLAEQKNIIIKNNMPLQTGVKCDKEITERIFVNLLTNAVKYTPVNGTVTISANRTGTEFIKIKVSDTGEGIPENKLSTIFEEYVQVSVKKSGKMRSTGLGLTFCKMATEAHGGKIFAESELNKGTSFIFTLPIGKEFKMTQIAEKTGQSLLKFTLSNKDKDLLKPYVKDLSTLMVYQISRVKKILDKINYKENESIKNWIAEVNNSLFVMNERKFKDLINQIS